MSFLHTQFQNQNDRIPRGVWPVLTGISTSTVLAGVYFAIVSFAESPGHALDQFVRDMGLVLPLILGFGIQTGLYAVLRLRLFAPVKIRASSGAMTGMSGATSTAAMVACCIHHVTDDVLPVLGLTAAAAFLAEFQMEFILLGLATTLLGIGFMLIVLFRERRKAMQHAAQCAAAAVNNGKSIWEGARTITLTIVNVDVPERIFTWTLP